jgi:hypothetical protein
MAMEGESRMQQHDLRYIALGALLYFVIAAGGLLRGKID